MSFDFEKLKNINQNATRFVEWVVEEIIRKKNWVALLILLAVVEFVALNPLQWPFPNLLTLFPQLKDFRWYDLVFWSSLAAIFMIAITVAVRSKKKIVEKREMKLSAIKGLLPFGHNDDDIEIFARLQRDRNLDEGLQAMNDANWRLGVISGESGAGKTSFLQAGLWPALESLNYRCVYVKFSDLDPFESVEQACVKQLSLSKDPADGDGFLSLIRKAARQDSKPLVLIFDQFEQFFVHRKQKKDRKPFVQALTDWYKQEQALPAKILISIRGDFFYRLNEFQEAMKYSLSPTQSFRLERFEPAQAAEVFRVIAEKEKLDCNQSFIAEMTKQELADRDDGLISPVDIQVLAWMVAGQTDESNRAFNRTAFQKLGGVEGLLERYLTRALDARETESRRQAATKVLLGLTDLERNTRAGALTIDALSEKLKNDLSDAELKEAVAWLSRGDVRLVAPLLENGKSKFELAHERIIPAIRRLAGRKLEPAARANQLLDSRANEWVGNGRNSRYLFSLSELRLIKKQKSFITWGKNKSIKDALIAASRRRLKIRFAFVCLMALFFTIGWFGWNTNRWQIYLIKLQLKDYGFKLSDGAALGDIAVAFEISGNSAIASQIVDRITSDFSKANALRLIADAVAKLGDKDRAQALLNDAARIAEGLNDNYSKADMLRSIAGSYAELGDEIRAQTVFSDALRVANGLETYYKLKALESIADDAVKLEDKDRAQALLNDALIKLAENFEYPSSKVRAFRSIADAAVKLEDKGRAQALLNNALKVVEQFEYEPAKVPALISIAAAITKLGDKDRARMLLNEAFWFTEIMDKDVFKANALMSLADAFAKLEDKDSARLLLNEALDLIENRSSDPFKCGPLSLAAVSFAKLGDKDRARALLNKVFEITERLDGSYTRAGALESIINAVVKFEDEDQVKALLDEALKLSEDITDNYNKAKMLRLIAVSFAKLGDKDRARVLLKEALKVAEKINDELFKPGEMKRIANSFSNLGESAEDVSVIKESFAIVEKIGYDSSRYTVIRTITQSRLVLDDLKSLHSLVSYLGSETDKAKALARIMTVYLHPELAKDDDEMEEDGESDEDK